MTLISPGRNLVGHCWAAPQGFSTFITFLALYVAHKCSEKDAFNEDFAPAYLQGSTSYPFL